MKTLEFTCLPQQLYEWARRSPQLPCGVNVGPCEIAEMLFITLFPNIRNYSMGYSGLSYGFSASEKGLTSGERSVEIRQFHRRAVGGDVTVYTVTITDTDKGVQSALDTIREFGLLDGEALIDGEVRARTVLYKQKEAAERKKIYRIFATLFMLAAVLGLFVSKYT